MASRRLRRPGAGDGEEEDEESDAFGSVPSSSDEENKSDVHKHGHGKGKRVGIDEVEDVSSANADLQRPSWSVDTSRMRGFLPRATSSGDTAKHSEGKNVKKVGGTSGADDSTEAAVKDPSDEPGVPRDVRYFLHDDRGGSDEDNDEEEEEGRKGDEVEAKTTASSSRRGRQRVKDEDGPWLHDKYYELVGDKKATSRYALKDSWDDGWHGRGDAWQNGQGWGSSWSGSWRRRGRGRDAWVDGREDMWHNNGNSWRAVDNKYEETHSGNGNSWRAADCNYEAYEPEPADVALPSTSRYSQMTL